MTTNVVPIRPLPQVAWEDAQPTWDDLTPQEQLDHIEICPETCPFCENDRAWGRCTWCGDTKESLPPRGESRCCGSQVAL